MPPENQFDIWAETYDGIIEQNPKGYPFAGYHETLRFIRERIHITVPHTRVLDLGIGTGLLSRQLYDKGAEIYGVDSSPKMLKAARIHMPDSHLHEGDIADDITVMFGDIKFHYIISSYAFHHFTDDEKTHLFSSLHGYLVTDGKIIIGDISFESLNDRIACQNKYAESWDNDEHYSTADTMIPRFINTGYQAAYHQISICSGVLILN